MSDKVKNVAKSLLFGLAIVVNVTIATVLLIAAICAMAMAMRAHPVIGALCIFLALVVVAAILYHEEHF